ncbi:MAG TPA: hypothetical protein VGO59_01505 [Verrucomicrobiae bacterium]|jgi:hypothetical protein
MRAFSNVDCLHLWESGAGLHPLDQGLLALSAALPETPGESLLDWPLGRRNAALAQLRCSSFGPKLQGWTACGKCGEKLEVEMDARWLTGQESSMEPVIVNGQSFRLVTSRDLAQAAREADVPRAAMCLAQSCCLDSGAAHGWSEEELEQIGQQLALADPLAETRLALRCPDCQYEWQETFDVAAFLWREIETRARKLLVEIHTLAAAYGWAEADILAMSGRRRAAYLEMAQS